MSLFKNKKGNKRTFLRCEIKNCKFNKDSSCLHECPDIIIDEGFSLCLSIKYDYRPELLQKADNEVIKILNTKQAVEVLDYWRDKCFMEYRQYWSTLNFFQNEKWQELEYDIYMGVIDGLLIIVPHKQVTNKELNVKIIELPKK